MSLHEAILRATFLGVKHEAGDIVDHIAIVGSLLASLLIAISLAIWLGIAKAPWLGALAGIATYALCMRICALLFFPRGGQG